MSARIRSIVAVMVALAAMLSLAQPAHAETAAERRERLQQAREQRLAERRAQQEERARRREEQQQRKIVVEPGDAAADAPVIVDDLTGAPKPPRPVAQQAKRIELPEAGFALKKPDAWQELPVESGVLLGLVYADVQRGQRETAVVRIYRRPMPHGHDLEAIARAWQQQALARAAFKYEPAQAAKLGGGEALVVIGAGQQDQTAVTTRAIFATHGGFVYMLESFMPTRMVERVMPAVQEMENSLQWLGDRAGQDVPTAPSSQPAAPTQPTGEEGDPAAQSEFGDGELGLRLRYPSSWTAVERPSPLGVGRTLLHRAIEPAEGQSVFFLNVIDAAEAEQAGLKSAREIAAELSKGGRRRSEGSAMVGSKRGSVAAFAGTTLHAQVSVVEHRERVLILGFVIPTSRYESLRGQMKALTDGIDWTGGLLSERRLFMSISQKGFGFSFPRDWKASSMPDSGHPTAIQVLYPEATPEELPAGSFADVLVISAEGEQGNDTTDLTPRRMAETLIAQARAEDPALEVIETHALRFGGVEGWQVVERHTIGEIPVQRLLACAIHDGQRYLFSFTAGPAGFERHRPMVEAVIESARIRQPPRLAVPVAPVRPAAPARPAPPTEPRPITVPAESAAKVAAAMQQLATFEDEQIGLRFSYPSAWEEQQVPPPAVLQYAGERLGGPREPTLTISILDKGPLTQNAARFARLTATVASGGDQSISDAQQQVGNKPGHVVIRVGADGRSLAAVVEHRTQMYVIVFAASDVSFEAWLPAVKAMLESVQWL